LGININKANFLTIIAGSKANRLYYRIYASKAFCGLYWEQGKDWQPEKFLKLLKHFNSSLFFGQGKKMTAKSQKGPRVPVGWFAAKNGVGFF
jgi:hypothetical protein